MRKLLAALALAAFAAVSFVPSAHALVSVRGYFRADGTYVPSYVRTNPNGTIYDNFSYKGLYPGGPAGSYVAPLGTGASKATLKLHADYRKQEQKIQLQLKSLQERLGKLNSRRIDPRHVSAARKFEKEWISVMTKMANLQASLEKLKTDSYLNLSKLK